MLVRLSIQNYALIESLEIEFGSGLNIITGETGAGKSILIGALGLALGERADSDSVRSGAKQAVVEAEFRVGPGPQWERILTELELEKTETLSLRREVAATGRSRAFIGENMVPLSGLKQLGDALVDMHGQHQHQSLLYEERHLDFLDGFAQAWPERQRVAQLYQDYRNIARELEELKNRERLTQEKLDLYQFQIKEIEAAKIVPGEEEELGRQQAVLANAEKLFSLASEGYGRLYQDEGSVSEQLAGLLKNLEQIADIDPRAEGLKTAVAAAEGQLKEAARELRRYRDGIQFDPARLEEIRQRLDLLHNLKKKYAAKGEGLEAVLGYLEKIKSEVDSVEHGQERIAELEARLEKTRREWEQACLMLSEKRQAAARRMSREVTGQLADLGMDKAGFEVEVAQTADEGGLVGFKGRKCLADATGVDRVRFLIKPNPGEEMRPLARIASGGEISRVMLAIKTILAEADQTPVLIFDEIDVGIGGRVAEAVGRKLRQIGQRRQVLCITHLPQIAALAQNHYRVSKRISGARTVTLVERLSDDQRVEEVARMLGGEKVSEAARRHAREMVGN